MPTQSHFILMIAGGLILFTSLFIRRIHRSMFSEPVLVMLIGLMLNLMDFGAFQIKEPHSLMNIFTRITIIVALISTALRGKHSFVVKQKRNLMVMIPLAMAGMWLLSSLILSVL